MGYVGKITAGGSTALIGSTLYGTCATAAGTAAKVVTCADFNKLLDGVTIHVKFTYSNTAANATMNVNGTGAKNLCRYGTTRVGTTEKSSWKAGAVVSFTYDGTSWVQNDYIEDTDTNLNTTYTLSGALSSHKFTSTLTPSSGSATTSELTLAAGSNVTLTDSGTTVTIAAQDTTYTAGAGLGLDGTEIGHTNSVTAGTAGTSTATSGSTLAVPYVTYDSEGHVTATGTHTHTVTGFSTTDTKNTAGSTNSTSKLFLIGATTNGSSATNPQTYSNSKVYATNGALVADTYSGYTLAAACAKGVDSSLNDGTTSTALPTSSAVVAYVTAKMGDMAGALVYKGTVSAGSELLNTPLSQGWYYIVDTAGSYAGEDCEAGDMVIVNTTGTYADATALAAAVDIVQTNIDTITNSEIDTIVAS